VDPAAVSTRAAPPADETDRFLEALEPILARYRDSKERREADVLFRAIVLAKDLRTCEALLRGEKVPRSRLDPLWAKAYGL
jgi:hypothetical protein